MILDVEFIENVQDFDVEFGENIENTTELEAQIKTLNAQIAELEQYATKVYEKGKQAQYDEFWEGQANITDWVYRFAGKTWNANNFKPPFNLTLTGNCSSAFNNNKANIDLMELLSTMGTTMNTSAMTNAYGLFAFSKFTRIGVIDFTGLTSPATEVFSYTYAALKTIEKIIVNENTKFSGVFLECTGLENLTIEGVIGQDGFNVQWSTKLSKASWISIIDALSPTATGKSITGSLGSVKRAFETSAGAMDGDTSAEWLNLIASKSNWTINLV